MSDNVVFLIFEAMCIGTLLLLIFIENGHGFLIGLVIGVIIGITIPKIYKHIKDKKNKDDQNL